MRAVHNVCVSVCYRAFTIHMCGCFLKDSAVGSRVILVVTIWKNSSMQSCFDISGSTVLSCVLMDYREIVQ